MELVIRPACFSGNPDRFRVCEFADARRAELATET